MGVESNVEPNAKIPRMDIRRVLSLLSWPQQETRRIDRVTVTKDEIAEHLTAWPKMEDGHVLYLMAHDPSNPPNSVSPSPPSVTSRTVVDIGILFIHK